jgi:serine phosphatase RsbU (regulator of sigma subunit)
VLSTDGVWEAMNAAQESYGRERLKARVREWSGMGAQAMVDRLYADVLEFCGGTPQRDDFTLVIVTRR